MMQEKGILKNVACVCASIVYFCRALFTFNWITVCCKLEKNMKHTHFWNKPGYNGLLTTLFHFALNAQQSFVSFEAQKKPSA